MTHPSAGHAEPPGSAHSSAPRPSAHRSGVGSAAAYWEGVQRSGLQVPADRPLADLTVELVDMLGSPDPHLRSDLAATVLGEWVARGVYDDLLPGLGDGMCAGLAVGRGEQDTDTVFRRVYSARVLTDVVGRDNAAGLVHPDTVLRWGDRALWWFLGEQDLRDHVEGRGRADAVGHGGQMIAALASSRHVDADLLQVLLDAVAERLLAETPHTLLGGADDRLAYATMVILHRNALGLDVLGPWLERVASVAVERADPQLRTSQDFLRALHLQLLLGVRLPTGARSRLAAEVELRTELLAMIARTLRSGHSFLLGPPDASGD